MLESQPKEREEIMVNCLLCDSKTEVVDSRYRQIGIRRRRRCKNKTCGHKFSTFEISKQDMNKYLIAERERDLYRSRDPYDFNFPSA